MKTRAQDSERQQEVVQSQKPHAKYEAGPSGRYASTSEPPAFQNPRLALGSIWNSVNFLNVFGDFRFHCDRYQTNIFAEAC